MKFNQHNKLNNDSTCIIYRMPLMKSMNVVNFKQGEFCNEFNYYLEELTCMNDNVGIFGDFNIDWLNPNGYERNSFIIYIYIYTYYHVIYVFVCFLNVFFCNLYLYNDALSVLFCMSKDIIIIRVVNFSRPVFFQHLVSPPSFSFYYKNKDTGL